MRSLLMRLMFGPDWKLVRRKANGSIEAVPRSRSTEKQLVGVEVRSLAEKSEA